GYSGSGKTSLVRDLFAAIAPERGRPIAGKYEEPKRNIPYSALVQAFSALVREWLVESEESLAARGERLRAALGTHGRVVAAAIPELSLVIGETPELAEVDALEARHRFNLTWTRFIRACAEPGRPLVLFLDDLQWADAASLGLIRLLMKDADLTSV